MFWKRRKREKKIESGGGSLGGVKPAPSRPKPPPPTPRSGPNPSPRGREKPVPPPTPKVMRNTTGMEYPDVGVEYPDPSFDSEDIAKAIRFHLKEGEIIIDALYGETDPEARKASALLGIYHVLAAIARIMEGR